MTRQMHAPLELVALASANRGRSEQAPLYAPTLSYDEVETQHLRAYLEAEARKSAQEVAAEDDDDFY